MTILDLEKILRHEIPLVSSLGARIIKANETEVQIQAPLEPNQNHLGTVFGGSLYSVSVLACYGWLFNRLKNENLICHVVIKKGQAQYLKPVRTEFVSVCQRPSVEEFNRFLQILQKKKKAQMTLRSEIQTGAEVACLFEGEFVAIS